MLRSNLIFQLTQLGLKQDQPSTLADWLVLEEVNAKWMNSHWVTHIEIRIPTKTFEKTESLIIYYLTSNDPGRYKQLTLGIGAYEKVLPALFKLVRHDKRSVNR